MAKVMFKRTLTDSDVSKIPIEDGNFIVSGSGTSYIDYGENRIPVGGTADTEVSDNSSNPVQNKVIKQYIDNKLDDLKNTLNDIIYNNTLKYYQKTVDITNLNAIRDGGHYEITLESFSTEDSELNFYINNATGKEYHHSVIRMIETDLSGSYYAEKELIDGWFYIDNDFPSITKIDLYITKNKISYEIKHSCPVNGNNSLSVLGGVMLSDYDNITDFKITNRDSTFAEGTKITVRKIK